MHLRALYPRLRGRAFPFAGGRGFRGWPHEVPLTGCRGLAAPYWPRSRVPPHWRLPKTAGFQKYRSVWAS